MATNAVLAGVIGTSVAIMIAGLLIPISLNISSTFGTEQNIGGVMVAQPVSSQLVTASNLAYILPLVGVAIFVVGMFGLGRGE